MEQRGHADERRRRRRHVGPEHLEGGGVDRVETLGAVVDDPERGPDDVGRRGAGGVETGAQVLEGEGRLHAEIALTDERAGVVERDLPGDVHVTGTSGDDDLGESGDLEDARRLDAGVCHVPMVRAPGPENIGQVADIAPTRLRPGRRDSAR
jgi:hypothetical protein